MHISMNFCPQRDIPEPTRRSLRQEANFGCAICGCPLIQMHHIIPWTKTHQHNPSDMIALCPTHHYRADMEEYDETYLRELKKSPHNQTIVSDAFAIQTKDLTVSIATNKFVNTPRVLVVDNFDIISVTKENQYPQLDANFFDRFDRWIAIIHQNQWYIDRRLVWDITYRPRHLTLRCKPGQISLDVKIVNDIVFIRGDLFFNGQLIEATKDDLLLGGRSGLVMRGGMAVNASVGLSVTTGKPAFSRLGLR